MANVDSFGSVFDCMNKNSGELEGIMSDLYRHLEKNPNDEMAKNILSRLGNLGQNMIYSQREFTTSYCNLDVKSDLLDRLDSRAGSLKKAQKDTEAKFGKR